ncbi:MAG: hypothetical protein Q9228_003202, partial [Teloschistes exilis]
TTPSNSDSQQLTTTGTHPVRALSLSNKEKDMILCMKQFHHEPVNRVALSLIFARDDYPDPNKFDEAALDKTIIILNLQIARTVCEEPKFVSRWRDRTYIYREDAIMHSQTFAHGLSQFTGMLSDDEGQEYWDPKKWESAEAMKEERNRRLDMAIEGQSAVCGDFLDLEKRPRNIGTRPAENRLTKKSERMGDK